MTNEEAIEIIKNMSICLARGNGKLQFFTVFTALKIAIEALEKQIPKKPLLVPDGKSKIYTFKCPTCGQAMYRVRLFCDDCGQAIDWSKGADIYDPV